MIQALSQLRISVLILLFGSMLLIAGAADTLTISGNSIVISNPVAKITVGLCGLVFIMLGLVLALHEVGVPLKTMEHYVLFWWRGESDWANEDWVAAGQYVSKFKLVCGFSIADAKRSKKVTIVGNKEGISLETEHELKNAGCDIQRLDGESAADTAVLMNNRVAKNIEFRSGHFQRSASR